ncbi:hypothetical protein JOD67_007176 [Tenggerimyces flavus]|nr:hypothetical protein [Tenggerimyces flavus]
MRRISNWTGSVRRARDGATIDDSTTTEGITGLRLRWGESAVNVRDRHPEKNHGPELRQGMAR